MTHISRPFQIALAAVALIAVVWFVALRGHSSGGESSSASSATAPTVAQTTPASAPTASTKVSTGASNLTKAIDKARATAKQNEIKAQRARHAQSQANAKPAPKPAAKLVSPQHAVEGELKQGRTVIVLFWSPKGTDDVAVRRELRQLLAFEAKHGTPRNKNIAAHYSSMAEVGRYGSITRSLQVLQTPTLLVIAPSGKTKTLTGLVDAYAIRQAIKEARFS